MEPLQLLDPSGEVRTDPSWPLDVTPDLCRDLYRWMRRTRRFDEEALALQRQGELALWLQSLGQEAAQVGSISALRPTDMIFPSYREHAAALYRGITPTEMLEMWRGTAHSGWDPARYRVQVYTVVLGAQLLHATGYAMGVQRDGADEVVVAYFGDGASSEGDASEALNWAAAADVPLLFFCQNNQWAISTPTALQMRAALHQRAAGFGLQSVLVNGNDVLAVHAVTRHLADQIRAGSGPAFVEAVTYRMGGHSTSDDPTRYRTAGELDEWRARDPLARLETFMTRQGWLDDDVRGEVDAECTALAAETRRACLALEPGAFGDLFSLVLAEPTPLLHAQRRDHESLVAASAD
ncbi:MAG: thiamine pyrophosphate-dependent dehydrogenase E1 component subunit alpha [Kineosporiaceae bacterium]